MSLRILQIMNRVPWPLKDGGSLGFYNYIKGYHQAGCEVTVCALNTNKHHVDMEQLPAEVKALADWRTVTINTDVKPVNAFLNLFSSRSYNVERFISSSFAASLERTLKEKTYDVVIFESIFVAPYLEVVRKNSKALLVLRQHNVEHHVWETLAANEKPGLKKRYLQILAKRIRRYELEQLNKFDALTTVTKQDADEFVKAGCNKPIHVSPFGIDMDRLKVDHSHKEPKSVFHLGSMEWLPNQQAIKWFLEEVWSEVVQEVPDAQFYLAGRGMPESFKKMEGTNIHVIGEVDNAVSFMQGKEVMIVPLFAGSGIRVKILEGMALGKAIVSTSLGAQGIEAENGKELIIANTAEEFSTAIIQLLKNEQTVEKIGQQARLLAEDKYDNTKVISRVLSFYKQQIGNIN